MLLHQQHLRVPAPPPSHGHIYVALDLLLEVPSSDVWSLPQVCGVGCYCGPMVFTVATLFGDMSVARFHCPCVGLSGCQNGSGNRLTKPSLITHLRDRHCSGEATHTLRSKCRYGNGSDFVSPPNSGDGVVQFVLYDLTKPQVPSCPEQLDHVGNEEESIVNAIRSWGMSGGSLQLFRETLAESSPTLTDADDEDIDLGERNIKQCKRKISDGHYTTAVRVLSSSDVAPYGDATLEDLKTKHPFKHAPSLPHLPFDHLHLIASPTMVLDRIKSFPRGMSCRRDGLRAQHLIDCLSGSAVAVSDELVSSIAQVVNLFLDGSCPKMLGEYIASAPLTLLVKTGGGIRPIDVGTVWRSLVSKVSALMISHSLDGYLDDLQFGVRGVRKKSRGYVMRGLVFDGTIVGDTLVVGKVLKLIMKDGPQYGLHLNVDKTEIFWLKEDPRSRLKGVFSSNIDRPSHGGKLLDGPLLVQWFFVGDIYGDHAVSCAGIIADMLLYSWDGGVDVCVNLTGSSPLTQTELADFVPSRAVIDVAQRKHGKYMNKCAAIGYGFLPFSFSSLGELEAGAVTLLERIWKFSITQDIGAGAAVHIFNRISFAIAKGVGA
ncbi:hypothetical protein Tco_1007148 [Tanacetum coccineum]